MHFYVSLSEGEDFIIIKEHYKFAQTNMILVTFLKIEKLPSSNT